MPDTMVRYTAYISMRERTDLDRVAEEQHSSANFILRSVLRHFLYGTPLPVLPVTAGEPAERSRS